MLKRKDGARWYAVDTSDSVDDSDFSHHYDDDWNADDERAVPFTSEGVRGTYSLRKRIICLVNKYGDDVNTAARRLKVRTYAVAAAVDDDGDDYGVDDADDDDDNGVVAAVDYAVGVTQL